MLRCRIMRKFILEMRTHADCRIKQNIHNFYTKNHTKSKDTFSKRQWELGVQKLFTVHKFNFKLFSFYICSNEYTTKWNCYIILQYVCMYTEFNECMTKPPKIIVREIFYVLTFYLSLSFSFLIALYLPVYLILYLYFLILITQLQYIYPLPSCQLTPFQSGA